MKTCKSWFMMLLSIIVVFVGLAPMAAKAEIAYANWSPGYTPPGMHGDKWGVSDMYWYGKARIFHYGLDAGNVQYRADDASSLWVEGKAPIHNESVIGAEAEWNTPLDTGYSYKFIITMKQPEHLPDLITINDAIVWEYEDGYTHPDKDEIELYYMPAADKETAVIRFIKRLDPGNPDHMNNWQRMAPPHQGSNYTANNFLSKRGVTSDPRPAYEEYSLPEGTQYIALDPHLANSYFHDSPFYRDPVVYGRAPLTAMPYPVTDTEFVERQIRPDEGQKYFRTAGIETSGYQPGTPDSFETWAQASVAAGTKNVAITPIIEMKDSKNPSAQPGVFQFFHLSALLGGSGSTFSPTGTPLTVNEKLEKYDLFIEDMANVAKRWLELVPDGEVYIFQVEMNNAFGHYNGGFTDATLGTWPDYPNVKNGGLAAYQDMFDFFTKLKQDIKAAVGPENADRVSMIANFDRAATQGAYAYKSGVDVILHKNIHRQSINVVSANSRGAGMAYDKEYGYDMDTWDRNYYINYHPEEAAHGLKVYYHAGGKYFMDETPVFNKFTGLLNAYGTEWLDFARYTKVHPEIGEQKVNFAVMRGLGDEWNRLAGPSASWEAMTWMPTAEMNKALEQNPVPQKWAKAAMASNSGGSPTKEDIYMSDYNLLDLVFESFGNSSRTNPDRLATGTPYGPVNFIPWDTSVEKMSEYQAIAYFGRGVGSTQADVDNLTAYVMNGGKLVVAAGQLRGENHQLYANEFLGAGLGEERMLDGELPYTYLTLPATGGDVESAEVLYSLSNGDPAAIKVQMAEAAGGGALFLLAGEWLTYLEDAGLGEDLDNLLRDQVMTPVLEELKVLNFSTDSGPDSGWLEYMMQEKGNSWVFPIFNHGRGLSPSKNGLDRGPWKGTVSVDLADLGLEGQAVEVYKSKLDPAFNSESFDLATTLPVTLAPVDFTVNGSELTIQLNTDENDIEELTEIVIGPASTVKQEFWGVAAYTPVTGIIVDQANPEMHPGEALQLTATVAPAKPEQSQVHWISDDESVAVVDENGLITAIGPGSAAIRAYVADPVAGTVYTGDSVVRVVPKVDYIVNDTFSTDTVGTAPSGWDVVLGYDSNTVGVSEATAGSVGNYVNMHRLNNVDNQGFVMTRPISSTGLEGKITVEAKVMLPSTTKSRLFFINNTVQEPIVMLQFNYQGNLQHKDMDPGTFSNTGLTYSANSWMDLKIELDTDDRTYEVYLNGVKAANTFHLIGRAALNVGNLQFRMHDKKLDDYYFDEVKVGIEAVPVTAVSLDRSKAVMQLNHSDLGTLQLLKTVMPQEATGRSLGISWTTSRADVATVDENGVVTAAGEGKAVITLTVADGMYGTLYTAQCEVIVEPNQQIVAEHHFDDETLGMNPADWTITAVSGNTAFVHEEIQGSGDYVLKLDKEDGSAAVFEAARVVGPLSGRVIVKARAKVPDASHTRLFNIRNGNGDLIVDARFAWDANFKITDGSTQFNNTGLKYEADTWYDLKLDIDTGTGLYDYYINDELAGTYRAIPQTSYEVGSVSFKMMSANTDEYSVDDVVISVVDAPIVRPPVEGISLSTGTAVVPVDGTLQLTASIDPAEAAHGELIYEWTSSDSGIAVVDAEGLVTALQEGTATIELTVTDPLHNNAAYTAVCVVTVEPKPAPGSGIHDTFDSDAAGSVPQGWSLTNGSATNTITVVQDEDGTYAKMDRLDTSTTSFISTRSVDAVGLTGKITVEADIKYPTKNEDRFIYINNANDEPVVMLKFTYQNKLYRSDDGVPKNAADTGLGYTANTWLNLKVELDTSTGQYELYVDGVKAQSSFDLISRGSMNVSTIQFRMHSTKTDAISIDNLRVEAADEEPVNTAPVLTPIDLVSVYAGQTVTLNVYAADGEGDSLIFSSPNLPAGSTLNADTGLFVWTPNASQVGSHTVTFTATDSHGESDSVNAAVTVLSENAAAILSGPAEVIAGNSFRLNFGLANVIDSVYSSVYAQHIIVHYDPDLVEFVSAESLIPGVGLWLTVEDVPGEVQLISASEGPTHAITGDGDLFGLNWIAKTTAQDATAAFTIAQATLANGQGDEREATGSVYNQAIVYVNKTLLNDRIAEGLGLYDSAVEGDGIGQYPAGTKALLLLAIQDAQAVAANAAANQEMTDDAVQALEAAIQSFQAAMITTIPGDVTGDGKVSIGDLGVVAANYGRASGDSGWDLIKHADLDNSNAIDLGDMVMIARRIVLD